MIPQSLHHYAGLAQQTANMPIEVLVCSTAHVLEGYSSHLVCPISLSAALSTSDLSDRWFDEPSQTRLLFKGK